MSKLPPPLAVKKLDKTVVNRIAAGEVIQRPANALKELLENSLDAKSSAITITVKNGGLKFLQIQDNGTGIRKDDMEIVCERFTTSKLVQFEDLNTIDTFGFRGEALASISHIAHLTITTKTADEPCAYEGQYEDGKLKGPLKSCAGNQGTRITVEDLFYNVATRRKSLRNPNEEHAKITDIVSKYAVHNPSVAFTLRKQNENNVDIKTNMNSTHVENIRSIYGINVAKGVELVEVSDDSLKFTLKGYMSNANYPMKKLIFLLFINNRLVDSVGLKKTLEQVYSLYFAKNMHPFLYLSLTIDPRNVDVNVHPTKHEVHFLYEDSIIDKIKTAIESKLTGCNTSRVFYTQTKLPGEIVQTASKAKPTAKAPSETVAANYLVRTDPSSQKLDKFFSPINSTGGSEKNYTISVERKREMKLTSVTNLRNEVESNVDVKLKEILQNFTYVGAADRNWSVIQHKTELYVCNNAFILEEMFYQLLLNNFGNFGCVKFTNVLPLSKLLLIGIDNVEGDAQEKANVTDAAAKLLKCKRAMLKDYFSLEIDDDGNLVSLPLLLEDYLPCDQGLPSYVVRLATDVNWDEETPCFQTFCQETASFYVYEWIKDNNVQDEQDNNENTELPLTKWHWKLEHVLYPAVKKFLLPSKKLFEKRAVLEVTSLPKLYKVFERC